jgi:hypothetical protein
MRRVSCARRCASRLPRVRCCTIFKNSIDPINLLAQFTRHRVRRAQHEHRGFLGVPNHARVGSVRVSGGTRARSRENVAQTNHDSSSPQTFGIALVQNVCALRSLPMKKRKGQS